MDGRLTKHTHLRMDEGTRQLEGSKLRDRFKLLHKQRLPNWMFGCDIDFSLVEKYPYATAAYFDLKRAGEAVTFSEVVAYNDLIQIAPLYLVIVADEEALEQGAFLIKEYLGGNPQPDPPEYELRAVTKTTNWKQFEAWERRLRQDSKG